MTTVSKDDVKAKLKELKQIDSWKDELNVWDVTNRLSIIARNAMEQEADPIELVAALVWAEQTIQLMRSRDDEKSQAIRQLLSQDLTMKLEEA